MTNSLKIIGSKNIKFYRYDFNDSYKIFILIEKIKTKSDKGKEKER